MKPQQKKSDQNGLLPFFFSNKKNTNSIPFFAIPSIEAPRLLIPTVNGRLYRSGFRIHNTAAFKNQLIKLGLRQGYLIAKNMSQKTIFSTPELANLLQKVQQEMKSKDKLWCSGYVGSSGKNQKLTLQLMRSNGQVLGYLKIADNPSNQAFMKNEYEICEKLKSLKFVNGKVPSTLYWGEWQNFQVMVQEPLDLRAKFVGLDLNEKMVLFLLELIEMTGRKERFENSSFMERLSHDLQKLRSSHKELNSSILGDVVKILKRLEKLELPFGVHHGDFTPYNVRQYGQELTVFDWEFARADYPPLFDLFHFIFQGNSQIKKMPFDVIIRQKFLHGSINRKMIELYMQFLKIPVEFLHDFFSLYLFDALVFDLANRPEQKIISNHFYQALQFMNSNRSTLK
ncbi:phosphotransferase [candidate division KSB1 bacterium]|nr:phosphotransferase [candidate division KSB1 bacterium]